MPRGDSQCVRATATRTHHRHPIQLVMVEEGREVVANSDYSPTREAARAAVAGPVGQQIAHAEAALDFWIGVPVEPGSGCALQAQDGDAVWLAPPAPGERAAVRELELTVFVMDAVVSHGHSKRLDPAGADTLDEPAISSAP